MGKNEQKGERKNQIISLEEAMNLASQGWLVADLHVHTFYSYDVVPTREVDPLFLYERARARGMSFVSFTDHDSMEAYDRIGWTREGVIPGVEVKIFDPKRVGHTVHLNVYTLNKKQFEEIEKIAQEAQNIELLIKYLETENLPFIFNHPFWHEPGEKLKATVVADLTEMFPILEYNFGRIRKLNQLMLELAAKKNKGVIAGTDSHTGDIGRVFSLAKGNDFREFFEAIKKGDSRLVIEDLTFIRIKQEIWHRLEMLLDSQKWVIDKEGLRMETGSALADKIIKILADSKEEVISIKKELLKLVTLVVSWSGVPASLYLKKQNLLANRIQQELSLTL
ncbi:MAG: hypothetical protein N3B16_07165 [Candidatus Aminicenantes bacterium]|nr:hypothetical protein [Candidatus Aminicenantes bacterium]